MTTAVGLSLWGFAIPRTPVCQTYAWDADPYIRHKKNNRTGNIHLPSLKKYFPWEAGRAAEHTSTKILLADEADGEFSFQVFTFTSPVCLYEQFLPVPPVA